MRKKPVSAMVVETKKFEDPQKDEKYDENQAVEAAAEDLLKAIDARDTKAIAEALRAAFVICDMLPHEEYPHDEDMEME